MSLETTKKTKEKIIITETPKDINSALFALQKEEIVVPRNGKGNISGREYKYATLDDVIAKIRPIMQVHNLLLTQIMDNNMLTTKIIHVPSGTEISGVLPLGNPATSQDLGSRITYLRRYALNSMLGLVLEDDVDGSQAKPDEKSVTNGPVSINIPTLRPGESVTVENRGSKALGEGGQMSPSNSSPTPQTLPTMESDAFKKAKTTIESCVTEESLEMVKERIAASPRLTDAEKVLLKGVVDAKDTELHGTVR